MAFDGEEEGHNEVVFVDGTYVVAVVRFVSTQPEMLDTIGPATAHMLMAQRQQAIARKDVFGEAHHRSMEFLVPLARHLPGAFPVLRVRLEQTAVHCPLGLPEMGYQAAWLAVAVVLDLPCQDTGCSAAIALQNREAMQVLEENRSSLSLH